MPPLPLVIGAVVHFASSSTYLWSTFKGRTKPNRVTFFIWSLAPLVGTAAGLANGVGWAVLPVFMGGFLPLLIFLVSFINPHAEWKLTAFDYICGALSILALVLWGLTQEPTLAIVFAILSDITASWPTIVKAYRFPGSEHFGAYVGSSFNAAMVFLVVQTYTFSALAFPVEFIVINSLVLFGIYRKRLGNLLK